MKNVAWPLTLRLHVNEVRVFTCYVNISINKLLTEPVYICFVNKDQRQKEWTGRGENFTSPPVRKTSSPLCCLSFPPPVSVFGRAGSVCFVWPPGPPASLCGTHALLWLPGLGYLAKEREGDRVSARRKRGSVFSHSALSLSIQRGLPGSWKSTYISFIQHINTLLEWLCKNTHRRSYYT